MHVPRSSSPRPVLPGWPEVVAGLITYLVLLGLTLVWVVRMPDDQAALRGIVGMAANGIAGFGGLAVAVGLRIREARAFGFRTVDLRWLVLGVALGLCAFGASFVIEHVYFHFIDEPNTQADFQAAAKDGVASLLLLLVAGAILTPLGEEFVFRGVVARAWNPYGVWAGVVASSAVFGIVHGLSVIFLLAFMVGMIAATLLRRTGSIWPGVAVHITYNGLHLLYYATL
jgi:membrane protease YdiL (CAAX protease family)